MSGLRLADHRTARADTIPASTASPASTSKGDAPWRRRILVALAALGAALSGYLTWVHYAGGPVLCSGVGRCEQVQASRFASVAGLPVALLGLVMYVVVLVLGTLGLLAGGSVRAWAGLGVFGLALAGVLYSAYLTYVELFVIGAICPWCVGPAVLIVAICVIATWDLLAPAATPPRAAPHRAGGHRAAD